MNMYTAGDMHELESLHWYRLRTTLACTRTSPSMGAHPIAIFQAIVKGVTLLLGGGEPAPQEELRVFFHLTGRRHTTRLNRNDKLSLEVLFCGYSGKYAEQWREALPVYLDDPLTGKNFDIVELGEVEERNLAMLAAEHGELPTEGEICLDFLTPLPFKPERDKNRVFISTNLFMQILNRRLSRLFGREMVFRFGDDDFYLLPYYWNYTEIRHPSRSQEGQTQYLNGCAGKLYIRGHFARLVPWILIASELHTGTKLSNSQGYFSILADPPAFFQAFFPRKNAIHSIIHEVLERYDNAAESLALTESYPFNDEQFAAALANELATGDYTPSLSTAFAIPRKYGEDRIVEQLKFRDLIVQQYLLKLVGDIFDRFFEEGSIGFRKGMSRLKAAELIRSALREGYCFIIESDIEDFFPSVDLIKLRELLEHYLPIKDSVMIAALMKCATAGCVLNGKMIERTRGLAQGSPLSPILANLYLDSFDERMEALQVRMVRFSDDFVIMVKSREQAEAILVRAEEFLAGIGLRLNGDKTSIKHISEGIQFLGMRIDGAEVRDSSMDDTRQFKKPLYIVEPFTFLALNGDAIEIHKNKEVLESIPLRRVGEIMIMEKASFSTGLIRRCTDMNIPVTITLNSGYYITTIKPDSKKYLAIAHDHARRYYTLTDTEILCIAKEIAAGKIANYISLFQQRYEAGLNNFIHELERIICRIHQTADVNEVRGHEGSAAKKVYAHINDLIENPDFHIKKRGRMEPDRINALLNFGYYLLFSRVNATVRSAGLNPYLGFLHSPHDNYESLVCDIEELFRSRIDRLIIKMINLNILRDTHFMEKEKRMVLSGEGIRSFIHQFEAELERKNSRNELSLKENIHLQVQVMKRYLLENKTFSLYEWKV